MAFKHTDAIAAMSEPARRTAAMITDAAIVDSMRRPQKTKSKTHWSALLAQSCGMPFRLRCRATQRAFGLFRKRGPRLGHGTMFCDQQSSLHCRQSSLSRTLPDLRPERSAQLLGSVRPTANAVTRPMDRFIDALPRSFAGTKREVPMDAGDLGAGSCDRTGGKDRKLISMCLLCMIRAVEPEP
jgi:hypothetical protein